MTDTSDLLDLLLSSGGPDDVAVQDGQASVTYAGLTERVNDLSALIERTVPAAGPLVIDLPRSVDLVIATLAALHSGRTTVPVEPGWQSIWADAAVARLGATHALVTGGERRDSVAVVALPGRPRAAMSSGAVYILHTSGSTGVPKAVAMGAAPLHALTSWHLSWEAAAGTAAPPVTAQFAPLTFDVAWQEIFTSLALGGTLSIVPDGVRREPSELIAWLVRSRATRLFLPTAYLPAVAEAGRQHRGVPDLHEVFVAGSTLRVTAGVRGWFDRLGRARLHNHYGPTETHVVTAHTLTGDPALWEDLPPIGRPLPHVEIRVVDESGVDVASGSSGHLLIGGPCLAIGYLEGADATDERFRAGPDGRWYHSGDRVQEQGGLLRFAGRIDRQVKVDGHRVEPAAVESLLSLDPDVVDAHVTAVAAGDGRTRLVAYVVARKDRALGGADPGPEHSSSPMREPSPPWRRALIDKLPGAAVPTVWIRVPNLPLTTNGKVDSRALPPVGDERPSLATTWAGPTTVTERDLCTLWEEHLGVTGLGVDDNFFDLGGTSLAGATLIVEVAAQFNQRVRSVDLYANPTIRTLAQHLDGVPNLASTVVQVRPSPKQAARSSEPIAIVGMSCRFPGAPDVDAFWTNLLDGSDSITRLDPLHTDGLTMAAGVLPDVDLFDAAFFGLTPQQAAGLDPQHRLFLECCHEALEDAAQAPRGADRSVGVFAGCGPSTYLLNNLLRAGRPRTLTASVEDFRLLMGTDKEFLAARVAYTLDLRGPCLNVNAACATSLVALHQAVAALRSRECDTALAGAASIPIPQLAGYEYEESMPFSPDAVCRVFDEDAAGTVFGAGVGVLALRRLIDAIADGDDIYAVVLGTGVSNDGAQKVGMTAPSVSGQERAIRHAIDDAGIPTGSIDYVEAHGTGTPVGDAIEVEALQRAYGPLPAGSIGIGSVKTNVGHLGWASGLAALVKAVMSLRHGVVPATLHHTRPIPYLASSPFAVVDRPRTLPTRSGQQPVRVAVNASGIGGFNAHVILEGSPERAGTDADHGFHVLPVSAPDDSACRELVRVLADATTGLGVPAADVARTLSLGRRHHRRRRAAVGSADRPVSEALTRLAAVPGPGSDDRATGGPVVGLMPGHGAERRGVARELYEAEPAFRSVIHSFDEQVAETIGTPLTRLMFAGGEPDAAIDDVVEVHAVTFALQCALTALLDSKGLTLDILFGHSLGQYAAACAAGVFSRSDGMRVVLRRGEIIRDMPPDGTMAVVHADEVSVRRHLADAGDPLDVAVVNSPENTVVSGPAEAIAAWQAGAPFEVRLLGSLRAGHSRLMRAGAPDLVSAFRQITLTSPAKPLICNITGLPATAAVATPEYWGDHLTSTVRFHDGLQHLATAGVGAVVGLGVGPGVLGLAARVLDTRGGPWLPLVKTGEDARLTLATAIAGAYEAGLNPDWTAVTQDRGRYRHLPTYPFQRTRHWVGPPPIRGASPPGDPDGSRPAVDILHEVTWREQGPEGPLARRTHARIAILGPTVDRAPLVAALGRSATQPDVSTVTDCTDPALRAATDVVLLLGRADSSGRGDAHTVDQVAAMRADITNIVDVVRTVVGAPAAPRLWLVTTGAQHLTATDLPDPRQRAIWGMGPVLAMEHPELSCTLIDTTGHVDAQVVADLVLSATPERQLAVRDGGALVARLRRSSAMAMPSRPLRTDRTYLITGGLTGLGLWTAESLAGAGARHLVLAGRRPPGLRAEEVITALRERGCTVEARRLDVSRSREVEELWTDCATARRPVGGVVHSAGAIDDAVTISTEWDQWLTNLTAKVQGGWNLRTTALRHSTDLDFLVLYSSATARHGNYGQAAYAVANSYLDGLALRCRADGIPAVSIAWGVLSDVGRVSETPELAATLRRRGLGTVSARTAAQILHQNLPGASAEVLVLPTDWERFAREHLLIDTPFFSEVLSAPAAPSTPSIATTSIRDELTAAPASVRHALLTGHILQAISRYLGTDRPPAERDTIRDLGMDSLSMIQLRNEMQRDLQTSLPPRLLTSHATAADLSRHLLTDVLELDAATAGPGLSAAVPSGRRPSLPPVTPSIEQRRWLALIRDAGYGRRVIPVLVHDGLDVTALHTALATVITRHEVLLQYFPGENTLASADVAAVLPAEDQLALDLSRCSTDDQAIAVGEQLRLTLASVPSPAVAPSWTVRALRLSSDRFLLLVAGEHLQFDGSGLSVFVDDVRETYGAVRASATPSPHALPAPYSAYAAAQAAYLNGGVEEDRGYFQGLFSGIAAPTSLPGRAIPRATTAHPARRYTPPAPLADWHRCRQAAAALTATPMAVLLSSYALLVSGLTNDSAVCVSIIRNARHDSRFAATVGPFTMPFPIPIHTGHLTAGALIQQVDDTLAHVSARPMYPATDLISCTRAFAGLPPDTYFGDVGLNFTDYRRPEQHGEPRTELIEILGDVTDPLFSRHDFGELARIPGLHLVATVNGSDLIGNYWYHQHRFNESDATEWAHTHTEILTRVTDEVLGANNENPSPIRVSPETAPAWTAP